jgi:hypothetical protein
MLKLLGYYQGNTLNKVTEERTEKPLQLMEVGERYENI